MNLIDIEKFDCKIKKEAGFNIDSFWGINREIDSYLENIEVGSEMVEYQPESVKEFEILFDSFCYRDIPGIKKECAKVYLKEYIKLEERKKSELVKEKSIRGIIPAYIYNF